MNYALVSRGSPEGHNSRIETILLYTIPIEVEKLQQLFSLITAGLAWYHWKIYINHETHRFRFLTVNPSGTFTQIVRSRVNEDIGKGAFIYEGI